MGKVPTLTKTDNAQIAALVAHFEKNLQLFETLQGQLLNNVVTSSVLKPHIHSVRARTKDPLHLRDKLERKFLKAKEERTALKLDEENLFSKINDLVGLRILHLHTQQIEPINAGLAELFNEFRYRVVEGPTAKTWDDEHRNYFRTVGIEPVNSPSLYTSVHYVIDAGVRSGCTCEIQVRTLAEELWGEVDHSINYPKASHSLACREQIKVLARATSTCSRLVDSIFRSEKAARNKQE
jgi:putative GTP pyrophosphokinase